MNKCENCIDQNLQKKSHKPIQCETGLLSLIHPNLGDLKNTMTRGSKQF